VDYEESTHDIFTTLEDGCWYFHIRAGDNVHNWNLSATHFGPVLVDTTSPDSMLLAINGGAGLTSSRFVSLSVNATDPSPGSGISQMSFSNDGSNWSAWEPYSPTRDGWDLTDRASGGNDTDGARTVFARVRDGVGREIPADRRARATVLLDRLAPEGLSLSINGGAGSANSTDVELGVAAHDPEPGSGLGQMAFSNDGTTWGDWLEWANGTSWSLATGAGGTAGDGPKTVFFRVKDIAGNTGGPANASVLLDTGRPRELGVTINGGALCTNDTTVSLNLSAADPEPGSPPLEMALSNSENATGAWEAFSRRKPQWSLAAGPGGTDTDGEKAVWLRVRDAAGNEGEPASGTIFLDRIAPGPLKITINAGSNGTNRPDVELSLEASDTAPSSGVEMMQFCQDGTNWSAWEPLSSRKRYTLSGPDGPKTILFQVRDRAGNIADGAGASIMLHVSPPIIYNITVSALTNDSATVSWTTDEPSTGRVEFGAGPVLDRNQPSAGWARNHTVRLTGLGNSTTYRFRVTSTDDISNNATSADRNFTTLESYTPPPPGPGPARAPEKVFDWAWLALPLLAVGAAAGLFITARKRRRKAPDDEAAEWAVASPAGPPEAMRARAFGPGLAGAATAAAVDWGQIGAAAAPAPADEAPIETLAMDDGIPTAPAVAVAPPAPPARPPPPAGTGPAARQIPPAAETPIARTVRCTGCGRSVPVMSTAFPVRIMCPGCGRNGVYRGPKGG